MPTYKHYSLVPNEGRVTVYDPRWPRRPLYHAENMERARRFVTAFRDGVTWAVLAQLGNEEV